MVNAIINLCHVFQLFIHFQFYGKRQLYDMDPKTTINKLNIILRLRITKLLPNIFVDDRLKTKELLIKTSRFIVPFSLCISVMHLTNIIVLKNNNKMKWLI